MAININHQLREQMTHDATNFPITFFKMNLLHYQILRDLCIGIRNLKSLQQKVVR